MEMKIKGNEFWVLENEGSKGSKVIFDNLDDAVKSVKELMEKDANPDDINLVVVDIGEEWNIKQVPWSEIASKLVKVK